MIWLILFLVLVYVANLRLRVAFLISVITYLLTANCLPDQQEVAALSVGLVAVFLRYL